MDNDSSVTSGGSKTEAASVLLHNSRKNAVSRPQRPNRDRLFLNSIHCCGLRPRRIGPVRSGRMIATCVTMGNVLGAPMDQLLTARDAAAKLGISVPTLYDWLGRSDVGDFRLRGEPFTVNYLQGGARGQGRILIEAAEIERIKQAMRVQPQSCRARRRPVLRQSFPGITVPLGRPDE